MLQHRGVIGLSNLLRGGFEGAEMHVLRRRAKPGTVAIDAGANVGVFTIPLAQRVGPRGRVLAFEPLPDNLSMLQSNVDMNALSNVDIHATALGDEDGMTALRLSADPAYASTLQVKQNRGNGKTMTVPVARLDSVWRQSGRPEVSAMKIDVEGGEPALLAGAEGLLAACKPTLLIEADTPERLEHLVNSLGQHGYQHVHPAGFTRWNHLFILGGGAA